MKSRLDLILGAITCLILLSLQGPPYAQADPEGKSKTIMTDPMWGVELKLDGYRESNDHPLYGKPNFVLGGTAWVQSCLINLSMFAEVVPQGTTAPECRKRYWGNPEALKGRSGISSIEDRAFPTTYTFFDQQFNELAGFVQNQLYGYWIRNDICFELHVSSVNCANFRNLTEPLLESVRIYPDNGATHETVAIARKTGKSPGNWKLHLIVAGAYTHSKPSKPDRARRFYVSALQRAGSELDPKNEWLIQEGMALTWLMEDNGEKALPYLMRAREISEKSYTEARSSTMHNLACAYALTGKTEKACDALVLSIAAVNPAGKEKLLQQIRSDKQLAPLHGLECYMSLLEDEGRR